MPQARFPFAPSYFIGSRSKVLPVLMYHRVLHQADPLRAGVHVAKVMDMQFDTLKRWFQVLPLDVAVDLLYQGKLPPRALAITFDDGYRDNHDLALPLLKRHGLHATFFVSSGLLNGGVMFHDAIVEGVKHAPTGQLDWGVPGVGPLQVGDLASRQQAITRLTAAAKYLPPEARQSLCERLMAKLGAQAPRTLMMDDVQVKALSDAGMYVGGHTVTHPIMAKLSHAQAAQEVENNRQVLHDITGVRPTLFAYPNGKTGQDYTPRDVEVVQRAGYACAMSTQAGVGTSGTHRFELPRFVLNETTPLRVAMRVMRITAFPVSHG